MIPQMILPTEGLSANIARVRPLVRVSPLVNQQIVTLGELSITEFTDELFLRSLSGHPSADERRRRRRLTGDHRAQTHGHTLLRHDSGRTAAVSGEQGGVSDPAVDQYPVLLLGCRCMIDGPAHGVKTGGGAVGRRVRGS